MPRNSHPTYAFSDDIEYDDYIDQKAEAIKHNTGAHFSNRKLSTSAIFKLMNAVENILATDESMFVSEETKFALEHLMPDSDGIDELFTFSHRSNQEEQTKRIAYKEKNGKNPPAHWLKRQRLYYLPRVVEKKR